MRKFLLAAVVSVATLTACGPDGYVFHPPTETHDTVFVAGPTVTTFVADSTEINRLIEVIVELRIEIEIEKKESMWLRQALRAIERIECANHGEDDHAHREDVCEIAEEELNR